MEILAQSRNAVDTILVAVGGGGLMAGTAAATQGRAKIVGIEPYNIPTLSDALHNKKPVTVNVSGIAADSLGASQLGRIAYDMAVEAGVASILVEDSAIVSARQYMWDNYRILIENGAAAAVAGLLSGSYQPSDGESVAVVLCGANTGNS